MTVRKVEIEGFSVISSKPFEVVVAALKGTVGQPNTIELFKAFGRARTFAELEKAVQKGLGRTGLMTFTVQQTTSPDVKPA
jgi:hypothetical protein